MAAMHAYSRNAAVTRTSGAQPSLGGVQGRRHDFQIIRRQPRAFDEAGRSVALEASRWPCRR